MLERVCHWRLVFLLGVWECWLRSGRRLLFCCCGRSPCLLLSVRAVVLFEKGCPCLGCCFCPAADLPCLACSFAPVVSQGILLLSVLWTTVAVVVLLLFLLRPSLFSPLCLPLFSPVLPPVAVVSAGEAFLLQQIHGFLGFGTLGVFREAGRA